VSSLALVGGADVRAQILRLAESRSTVLALEGPVPGVDPPMVVAVQPLAKRLITVTTAPGSYRRMDSSQVIG